MSIQANSVTIEYTCPTTGGTATVTGDSSELWTSTEECDCCGITVIIYRDVRECSQCGQSHEIKIR